MICVEEGSVFNASVMVRVKEGTWYCVGRSFQAGERDRR